MAGSPEEPAASSPEQKTRVPMAKLLILYFISSRGGYKGTIVQMSRDMNYQTDSSVNKNLHELIRDGYVIDDPYFKLTGKGEAQLQFSRLPEALCAILMVLGLTVMLISGEGMAGLVIGRLASATAFGLGLAVVGVSVAFLRLKKRVYDDFLGLRKPLSGRESLPREVREPDSPS